MGAAARFAGSKTITSSADWHETKARPAVPAKTTSQGSSRVLSVARTENVERSTMLTEAETWLTTQASVLDRARTETGSSPTGTAAIGASESPRIANTSRRASAVFTASRRVPSGVSVIGWTCGDSQLTKAAAGAWA